MPAGVNAEHNYTANNPSINGKGCPRAVRLALVHVYFSGVARNSLLKPAHSKNRSDKVTEKKSGADGRAIEHFEAGVNDQVAMRHTYATENDEQIGRAHV